MGQSPIPHFKYVNTKSERMDDEMQLLMILMMIWAYAFVAVSAFGIMAAVLVGVQRAINHVKGDNTEWNVD